MTIMSIFEKFLYRTRIVFSAILILFSDILEPLFSLIFMLFALPLFLFSGRFFLWFLDDFERTFKSKIDE